MNANLRPSPIAGQWYEGNPAALTRSVDKFLDQANLPKLNGNVIAVIAPHAGHRYSGPVAGYSFAALRGRNPELVAVLSPFHNYHSAPFLTSGHSGYATPLGAVDIDHAAIDELNTELKSTLGIELTSITHDLEHSLEIELPFLQRALKPGWKLLPVMSRAHNPELAHGLGLAIAKILKGKNAILVASTDLSHFYDQKTANLLDGNMLSEIESFDPENVLKAEATGKGFACGLGALTSTMWAARELGADKIQILHHATSGDVTGDYSEVVGYGAAVILKSK
jgi:hypothetical protein